MKKPEVQIRRLQWNRVRPDGVVVDGALVHSMAELVTNDSDRWGPVGTFPAADWLDAKEYSANALVVPDGTIVQLVPIELVAFHAGVSEWKGRRNLNDSFLGAEWLVAGAHAYGGWIERIADPEVYTPEQYHAGGWLYATWLRSFPDMELERILGHSQVAGDDVRGLGKGKRDPGPGFSWDRFYSSTKAWLEELNS